MRHAVRHLLWIVPLAALIGVSAYHQLTRAAPPGEMLARALQAAGFGLRNAAPVLEYVPGNRAAPVHPLVLAVRRETFRLPPGTQRVVIDTPPWRELRGNDLALTLRGDMVRGYVDRELHRADESAISGTGVQLRILGNEFLLSEGGGGAALSVPNAGGAASGPTMTAGEDWPPLTIDIRGVQEAGWPAAPAPPLAGGPRGDDGFVFRRAPSRPGDPGTFRELLLGVPSGDPREASLARAVLTVTGTQDAAQHAIAAARASLAALSDEDLFVAAVTADAGVLGETRDAAHAVELAVLLVYCDADGAVAMFHGGARTAHVQTIYTVTLRADAAASPPRCRIYCFESGREIWHATLCNPRAANLTDFLHALIGSVGSTADR